MKQSKSSIALQKITQRCFLPSILNGPTPFRRTICAICVDENNPTASLQPWRTFQSAGDLAQINVTVIHTDKGTRYVQPDRFTDPEVCQWVRAIGLQ